MDKFRDVEIMMDAYKRLERIDTGKLDADDQLAHADALDGLSRAILRATKANLATLAGEAAAAKLELERATKRLGKRLEALKKAISVIDAVNRFLEGVASLWKLLKTP